MKEIIRVFPTSEPSPLHIQMAGISYCDGSYHIYRASSDITVIEYILEGEGCVILGDKTISVTADQIYILPKGTEHEYRSSAQNPWKKIFLNLSGNLPLLLLEQYGLSELHFFDGGDLKPLFLKIAELVEKAPGSPQDESTLSALFFETVARLAHSSSRAVYDQDAVHMKDLLDSSTHRIVSNAELAASVFRSTDYCIKLFRREYGVTPYEYQLSEKMRIARHLLRDTTLPVSAVASSLGYEDPQYFSGLFKRKCGIPPRTYRKKQGI